MMGKGNQNTGTVEITGIDSDHSESLWETVEKTYKSSERRYKLLAENVTDVIWTMGMNYVFTYVSPSVIHMRGYSAEEAVLQSLHESFTPESSQTLISVLDSGFGTGSNADADVLQSKTLELYQTCKYGPNICTETKLTYLRDSDDIPIGILGVARDVTERKRIEEQLKHSELLASLGKMTAGIAHEVNNPLGSILLFSEMMMKSGVSSDIRKDLKVIHDEAKRAAKVMSDLLTYSLGGNNNIARVNIRGVIRKVLDMRLYAQTVKNIDIVANLPESLTVVYGDRAQLVQVFMNIMLNAEEALEEKHSGCIRVTMSTSEEWVKVMISDDGIGIPDEKLSQIFYPFYTTKGIGEGTGLGLSTCYGIITSHGGLIHAENNAEGGVTMIVELPLARY